ncbi:hypothetical protein BH10PSE12_BH10PSE12_03550 [soil metagenome]
MDRTLHCWLYVSTSKMSHAEKWAEFDQLIALSRSRNATLDVTGALLFSGTRFAQFLEGPPQGVAVLQDSIRHDSRHDDIITLNSRFLDTRLFPEWSLAYDGMSQFVEKVIDRALEQNAGGSRTGVDTLLRLLKEFAAKPRGPRAAH